MEKEKDIINDAVDAADAFLVGFTEKFFGKEEIPKTPTEKMMHRIEQRIGPRENDTTV